MAARKTTTRKTTTKKAGERKKAPARKATSGRKRAAAAEPREKTRRAKPASSAKSGKQRTEKVSSMGVNLGHIFTLRPRPNTSFRQEDFRNARRLLQDETYATIEDAARAVAAKALELTHDAPLKGPFRPRP